MAKSETDKVEWLSALEHQMKLRKTPNIGTVANSNRIVHEVKAANYIVFLCNLGILLIGNGWGLTWCAILLGKERLFSLFPVIMK